MPQDYLTGLLEKVKPIATSPSEELMTRLSDVFSSFQIVARGPAAQALYEEVFHAEEQKMQLLKTVFQAINRIYSPGLLDWLEVNRPRSYRRYQQLMSEINFIMSFDLATRQELREPLRELWRLLKESASCL